MNIQPQFTNLFAQRVSLLVPILPQAFFIFPGHGLQSPFIESSATNMYLPIMTDIRGLVDKGALNLGKALEGSVNHKFTTRLVSSVFDIEHAMRQLADNPKQGEAEALSKSLDEARRIHNISNDSAIEAIAGYHLHAISLMANVGIKKTALKIAESVKREPPYSKTQSSKIALNPETYALYANVHPEFDSHPINQTHTKEEGRVLFASDLSGTLYVSGKEPDLEAIGTLRDWFTTSGAQVAYISGKSFFGVWEALTKYALPVPNFVASEVGTRIYLNDNGEWRESKEWESMLGENWFRRDLGSIDRVMKHFPDATFPEFSQSKFKRTYRLKTELSSVELRRQINELLEEEGTSVNLSVGSHEHGMHIDFLPNDGSKLGALKFMAKFVGVDHKDVFFSGDSGTESEALKSGVRAIFVGSEPALLDELRQYPTIYVSNEKAIRGVIEGIKQYGII